MTYHIRRSDREITDQSEIQSILAAGKYGIIGLSNHDDPYVVTLSYGYDKDANALYFHCGKEGQKIDFIKANPRACVTIIQDDGYDDGSCDHSYKSLVLRGEILFVKDPVEADRAIRLMVQQLETRDPDHFLAKLKNGNKSYDNLRILKLSIASITGKKRQKNSPTQTDGKSA